MWVLPVKAKEERKYPHVTADLTWMRLIISSYDSEQILYRGSLPLSPMLACLKLQEHSTLLLLLDIICALQLLREVLFPICDSTPINKYNS